MKPLQKKYLKNYCFALVICMMTMLHDGVYQYLKFIVASLVFSLVIALIFTVSEILFYRWSDKLVYQMKNGKKKTK